MTTLDDNTRWQLRWQHQLTTAPREQHQMTTPDDNTRLQHQMSTPDDSPDDNPDASPTDNIVSFHLLVASKL
jgi:hypothetical protein